MKSFAQTTSFLAAALLALSISCLSQTPVTATPQARRLILKDGTYQSVTKYEIHGDRVRYFSAERGEWEEVPKALIDWDATDKFEQGRQDGKVAPEAAELDKQLEAERKAEQARSPEIAPGLRLPDEGGVFILDTYQNQAQLAELQQSGGDLDKNTKTNVLRTMINPLAGTKQTIELPDAHSKVQSHTAVPSALHQHRSQPGRACNRAGQLEILRLCHPPSASSSSASKLRTANARPGRSRSP